MKIDTSGRYMQRIMRAHYVHHKVHSKEGAEAFGFLYAPKRYDKPMRRTETDTEAETVKS